MKARLVIGIALLILTLFCVGPMILMSGLIMDEERVPAWTAGLFGLPAMVLLLIGTFTIGSPYRIMAAAWTLVAGAFYGVLLLLTVAPMFLSPDWNEMLRASQAQMGNNLDTTMGFSFQAPSLLIAGLLFFGVGGLAHFYLGKGDSLPEGLTLANWRGPEPQPMSDGSAWPARPVSVTIFAWFVMVTAIIGFLVQVYPGVESQRTANQIWTNMSGVSFEDWRLAMGTWFVLIFVSAAFFLRGANWARWSFLGGSVANLVLAQIWFDSPSWSWLGSSIWLLVPVYLLFVRRPANHFFRSKPVAVTA